MSSFHCNSSSIFSCNVKHFYIVHVFGPCNFVMASQKKRQDYVEFYGILIRLLVMTTKIFEFMIELYIILILNDIDLVY